jgi:hypothetical protein
MSVERGLGVLLRLDGQNSGTGAASQTEGWGVASNQPYRILLRPPMLGSNKKEAPAE